jgi:hypothetical protein
VGALLDLVEGRGGPIDSLFLGGERFAALDLALIKIVNDPSPIA